VILSEFNIFLLSKRKGDIKLPKTNEELQPLLQESLEYVAKKCVPISLVEDACISDEKFIMLNNEHYIRKPIAHTENDAKIDIDQQLVYAVAYDLLANKSNDSINMSRYESKRDDEIADYIWYSYKFLQELKD
jgi:hypothetical protein